MTNKSNYYASTEQYKNLYCKAKDGYRFKNLMSRITKESNIQTAYNAVKNDKTCKELNDTPMSFIVLTVRCRLDRYKPEMIDVTKNNEVFKELNDISMSFSAFQSLNISSAYDRLIQQCILQVLEPILEAKFHNRSYGYRPDRNAENAVADMVYKVNQQRLYYVVDCKICDVIGNINHSILLKLLRKNGICDDKLLMIIKSMLNCKVRNQDGSVSVLHKGVSQCGILSPLFLNVYLNELDWWVSNQWETFKTKRNYIKYRNDNKTTDRSQLYRALRRTNLKEMYIVRYGEDFKIITNSKESGEAILYAVSQWLERNLSLSLDTSRVCDLRHTFVEFLGFDMKIVKKGRLKNGYQRYIMQTDVSEQSLKNIKTALHKQIALIAKHSNTDRGIREITKYNSMVIAIHKYYCIATNCNNNFNVLSGGIQKQLYNRLVRNNDKKRGGRKNFQRTGVYHGSNAAYLPYMKSQTVRWFRNYPILPIGYIQHKYPKMKSVK